MNYKKIMLGVMGLVASSVYAQSSVTMYGRVSSGLDYVNNVAVADGTSKNQLRFGSNQFGISWWGLKGYEDLGGGLRATFNLESMFTLGQGQLPDSSTLFNRFAYVGLSSTTYGDLWLGRVMALTDETGYYLDPFGEGQIGIGNLAKGRAWGSRANTVTYNSRNYGGLSFRLQTGLGNQAANFRGGRQYSASAQYSLGDLNAYAVYEEVRDSKGKFSSLYSASKEYMIGATYQIDALKIYGGFQQLYSSGADTVADSLNPAGATRSQQEWIAASYRLTPALAFQAGWFHANVNHGGGSGNLAVLGAVYSLSKRTSLYATVAGMFNGGKAAFPVETNDSAPLPGHNQQGGYFGMIQYF